MIEVTLENAEEILRDDYTIAYKYGHDIYKLQRYRVGDNIYGGFCNLRGYRGNYDMGAVCNDDIKFIIRAINNGNKLKAFNNKAEFIHWCCNVIDKGELGIQDDT